MGGSVGMWLCAFVTIGGDLVVYFWYLFHPLSRPRPGIVRRIAIKSLSTPSLETRAARLVAVCTV